MSSVRPRAAPRQTPEETGRSSRHGTRARSALGSVLFLIVAASAPGTAQDIAHQERFVDRLAEMYRSATRRADSLTLARNPLDTIEVTGVTIFAEDSVAALVREAAAVLASRLDSAMGGDVAILRGLNLYARRGYSYRFTPQSVRSRQMIAFYVSARDTPEWLAGRMMSAVAAELYKRMPAELADWVRSSDFFPFLGMRRLSADYWGLATSPSAAVEACFRGALGQCDVALGIVPLEDPVSQWYDAEQRRSIIEESEFRWHLRHPRYFECVERMSDDACVEVMKDAPLRAPISSVTRASLLGHALERGGEGAYTRLMHAEHGTIKERLGSIAGEPADSLVADWYRAVMAARPEPPVLTRPQLWAAVFWTIAFLGLGLRSTRWR